tara:strand:- start:739 stop:1506 length:768 start_codon:yes stop_codon:yes gene_type:complete
MKTSKPFKLRSQGLPFKEMGSSPLNEGFGVLASDANKEEAFNTRLDLDKKVESNVTANKESQEANDESWWGSMKNKAKQAYDSIDVNKGLDNLQTGLTAAGMVPGVGNAVDLLNAGISGGRATYAKATGDDEAAKKYAVEGATNLAAAAPGAGLAVGAAKLSSKAVKAAKTTEKASDVTENVAKVAKTKKTLEKSSKVADATTGGAQLASNNEKKQDKPNNNKPKDNKPKEKKKVDKPKIAKVDKKKDKGGSDKA